MNLNVIKSLVKRKKDFKVTISNGQKKSAITYASMDAYEKVLRSKTSLIVAETRSKSIKVNGDAEEKSSEKLKAKRRDNVSRGQIKVFSQLGTNQDVVISGSSNYSDISQIVGTKSDVSISVQTNNQK